MQLCEVCARRSRCRKLCAKAEKWVDKLHVSQREMTGFDYCVKPGKGQGYSSTILELLAFESVKGGCSLVTRRGDGTKVQTAMRASWSEIQTAKNISFPEYPFLRDIENKILRAFYFDGQTYRQIARRYGKKHFTVKSMLSRAKKKIASVFYKDGKDKIE